ncbi:MAG: YveK family protein [Lachnospirales bacterium]
MNSNLDLDAGVIDIDIKNLVAAVLSKAKMIVLFAVVFGLSSFLLSEFVIVPKYQTNISMCINNNATVVSGSLDFNDVNASITLVPTYIELLQSNSMLSAVAEKVQELGYTANDIADMISVSTTEETQIISVTVTSTNPEHANIIANAIAETVPDKIVDFMDGTSVRIIDGSTLPDKPASPNVKKNTLLGFILGGIIGIALAVAIELMDNSVKNENDLNNLYPDLPILGVIPTFTQSVEKSVDYKDGEKKNV